MRCNNAPSQPEILNITKGLSYNQSYVCTETAQEYKQERTKIEINNNKIHAKFYHFKV